MKCPYCSADMVDGTIYGDRYQLKWLPKSQKLLMGIWAKGGLGLGQGGLMGRSHVEASLCDRCQKLVIDVSSANQ